MSIQVISLFWLQKPCLVAVEVEVQQLHLGPLLEEVGEPALQFDRSPLTAPIVYLLQAIPQIGLYLDVAAEEARVVIIKVKQLSRTKIQQNLLKQSPVCLNLDSSENSPIRKPTN